MYHYQAAFSERMEVDFIQHAAPEAVYGWFRDRWKAPEGQEFGQWSGDGHDRQMLEYLACRRRHPLIDSAIARFGYTRAFIQRVYNRGSSSTRLAALANPRGNHLLAESPNIILSGSGNELDAFFSNAFMPGEILEELYERKGRFKSIDDQRFMLAVARSAHCPRLTAEYDGGFDGYAEYSFNKVFTSAWSLAATVPATQKWASVLWSLYGKCQPPIGMDDIPETLARWRIDKPPEREPIQWHNRSYSFNVRMHLAGLIRSDGDLVDAEDPAMRMAFYKRLNPSSYPNWPEWVGRDGCEFAAAALDNKNLWRSAETRELLRQVCWAAPDPGSHMDLPNDFRAREVRMREMFPEWFHKRDMPEDSPLLDAITSLGDRLDRIEESLRVSPQPKRGFFS